jgi:hypothetical protein
MKGSYAFEVARKQFRPDHIKALLIAEAPPSKKSQRFFYFIDVPRGDTLFLETMKVLYPKEFCSAQHARLHKKEFLRRFMNDGFYLIDACKFPMPTDASFGEKKRAIKENLPFLRKALKGISKLCDSRTKVILISKSVYVACSSELASLNVINDRMIDSPASGRQRHFRRKLGSLLKKSGR